jgi:uncharacterized protein DUF4118
VNSPMSSEKAGNGREATNEKTPWSLPSISLPKRRGGAIRGISEKLAVDSVVGTRSVIVPICMGRGRSRYELQLTVFPYALAAMVVGGAVIAALGLGSVVKHAPTLFLCAVVLTSWFSGVWPGIFSALLSVMALDYYFISPIYALGITLEDAPDMIAFEASALFVSWLSGKQKEDRGAFREAPDKPSPKVGEWIPKPGKSKDQLHAGSPRRGDPKEDLMEVRTELARLTRILTRHELAAPITDESRDRIGHTELHLHSLDSHVPTTAVLHGTPGSLPDPLNLCPQEESVFFRQGDYWTVKYQGQIANLKATRGMQYLACLLGHPGREFHACDLAAQGAGVAIAIIENFASGTFGEDGSHIRTAYSQDAGPILDARAKAQYAARLAELREELEDAKRLNDRERTDRICWEKDCIADQLAVGVGLGGRNRKAASHAERARSAVTKRIKDSIHKISQAMPSLGRHFVERVKTGYFCSYNPHPDRPVKWNVRS